MCSRILKKQMAYEPIVGHRLPWECISQGFFTAFWIRPIGRRIWAWPPKKTTCFGLGTKAVSQPSHKSNDLCGTNLFSNDDDFDDGDDVDFDDDDDSDDDDDGDADDLDVSDDDGDYDYGDGDDYYGDDDSDDDDNDLDDDNIAKSLFYMIEYCREKFIELN
ncbi:unnamed protein product [Schistosoma margrebowiei]|uniref:Uncharacterized protein n=1 Tax=Schistosoma margrebowiei TaxID=48269 RepID=A0A183L8J7_9TREM|nr:unnamed protein product [Schistosoma margrebowiei]